MTTDWAGVLLFDKPEGPTSHDIVARVRRITGQRRIGHTGTLDPAASGLLPLALGRATRLIRFLPDAPKTYTGTLRLGIVTSTDDTTGDVVHRTEHPLPGADAVREAAAGLTGEQLQLPPRFSAKKVGGQRLYRLARKGVEVERKPSPVVIHRFTIENSEDDPAVFGFRTEVTAGTYVRSLVRDLGEALGCGATMASLRRTAIGPWSVEDAVTVERDDPDAADRLREALVPPETLPLVPPSVQLGSADDAARFRQGNAIFLEFSAPEDGPCAILDLDGRLIGVGERIGTRLQPRVVI